MTKLLTIKGLSDKEGYNFSVTNYAQGQENHWLKDSFDFMPGMKPGELYRKKYTGVIKRLWAGYKD